MIILSYIWHSDGFNILKDGLINNLFIAVFIALLLDKIFADLALLHRIFWHPVEWLGRPAVFLEKICNHGNKITQFSSGAMISILLLGWAWFLAHSIGWVATKYFGDYAILVSIFFLAWLLSARSLHDHVAGIWRAGHNNHDICKPNGTDHLLVARKLLGQIVGRQTANLTESQISAGAIESLAENFSDGVMAPLFYFLCFGIEGVFCYKCLNTLDSLYGYRNQRYQYFGKFAAIADDIANFIPARLSAFVIFLTGIFYAPKQVLAFADLWQIWNQIPPLNFYFRSNPAKQSKPSPNAIYSEVAFAHLLDIQLGGIRQYSGGIQQVNIIGLGREKLKFSDIDRALTLYRAVILFLLLLFLFCAIVNF